MTQQTSISTTSPGNQAEITRLTGEIDVLVERLNKGEAIINQLKAEGRDYSKAEARWIDILHEYEKKCDRRRELGYPK